jgi:Family of unknown function (DUF6155)
MKQRPSPTRGPGKREVRKLLSALSREALVDEVMRMYDDFAPVREYLSMRVSPDDTVVREKYKRIVEKEFSFSFTRTPRLSVARKAVLDYRKVAASAEGIADVMLHYVEQAAALAADVGGDDALFTSILRMYRDAVDHIVKHGLQDHFRERSRRATEQDFGYGVSDAMRGFHTFRFESKDPDDEEGEDADG